MHVLYLCGDAGIPLDGHKGASVHVRQTVGGLRDRGFEVSVVVSRPEKRNKPWRFGSRGVAGEAEQLATTGKLLQSTEDLGNVDVIYERQSLWSLTGLALAEHLDVPLVLEVNAPLVQEAKQFRELTLTDVAASIEEVLYRRAEAIFCVSRPLVRHVTELRGHPGDVHLSPNVVNVDRFRPAGPRSDGEAPLIVFVGSLKPWHGLETLIEALAQIPAGRLMLIGDGPLRRSLEKQALALGVTERVEFRGAVDHAEVPGLIAGADIAVAPYPAMEPFYFSPLKIGEYLACGLPVVTSSLGDLAPMLRHRDNAYLVRPGDVDDLARGLKALVDDRSMRRTLGQAGRKLALEQLSLDGGLIRLQNVIARLVGQRRTMRGGAVS